MKLSDHKIHSKTLCTPAVRECGVHAVCLSMDELSPHARNECQEYHPNVGYVSGSFARWSKLALATDKGSGGRPRRVFSVPSLCMFGLPDEME